MFHQLVANFDEFQQNKDVQLYKYLWKKKTLIIITTARKVYILTINHEKLQILPIFNEKTYLSLKRIMELKNINCGKSSYVNN